MNTKIVFVSLSDSSKSSEESSRFVSRGKMESKSHWVHRTTLESLPSTISSDSKSKRHNSNKESMAKSIEPNKLPEWDSHLNMQQLVKNRTKLKTPNSDESIEAYAKACRAKFDRKCAKTREKNHEKKIVGQKSARDQPIYTKPYSSDSYSDIQNIQYSSKVHVKQKPEMITDAYTSVSGSDGFLSPNSISIGVAANSTSNTTTHQYDTKISIGLQTTNTLERMPIIQLKKTADVPKEIVSCDQPTVRVNKLTINKQLQVRPESLAYIIMFKDDVNSDENRSSSSSRSNNNNKLTDAQKTAGGGGQFRNTTNSHSSSVNSLDNLTLQECLQARRPDFYANAEQRRKCLSDLHNLR